jgi:hypothetical protein
MIILSNKREKHMLRKITKQFLMNEAIKIDPAASVQALYDIVSSVRVTNKRDTNRISLAKEHLRGIKRQMRSLNEKIGSLEEELNLLKEEK